MLDCYNARLLKCLGKLEEM